MLAVLAEQRLKGLPDTPTLKELGYGLSSVNLVLFAAPKNLPADVAKTLIDAFAAANADPAIAALLDNRSLNAFTETGRGAGEEHSQPERSVQAAAGSLEVTRTRRHDDRSTGRYCPRSRASLLVEAVVLVVVCVLALVWFIPAQTSEGGFGLSPGFLPKLCVAAIGVLIAADGVLRLIPRRSEPTYAEGWGAFLRLAAATCLGTLALRFGGMVPAAAVCCIATALALGERRLVHTAPALVCAAVFWLVFR